MGLGIDDLADLLQKVRQQIEALRGTERQVVEQLAALATAGGRTRRLRGLKVRLKIEMPDDAWDQARLRSLWHNYPHERGKALRIDRLGVNLVEYKKILGESGEQLFEDFKRELGFANLGPRGLPRVTIEEDGGGETVP